MNIEIGAEKKRENFKLKRQAYLEGKVLFRPSDRKVFLPHAYQVGEDEIQVISTVEASHILSQDYQVFCDGLNYYRENYENRQKGAEAMSKDTHTGAPKNMSLDLTDVIIEVPKYLPQVCPICASATKIVQIPKKGQDDVKFLSCSSWPTCKWSLSEDDMEDMKFDFEFGKNFKDDDIPF